MRVANPQQVEEFTAEPWTVFCSDEGGTYVVSGPEEIALVLAGDAKEHARRIAACVNRLSDIPTSLLEDPETEMRISLKRPACATDGPR